MLENERIIVQDRGGIDAGIAALMQNANKGFDPAALMAMMNNGNGMFGGNGGWWWIFIIVLFWMWGGWGGNGFGRGNQAETNSDFARLAAMGNQNNNTDLLMQAINGNKDAINTLSTNLNCDVKSIDNALCSIQNAIGKVGGEVGFSAERVINAINLGDANLTSALQNCCCQTQQNIIKMGYEQQLATCGQTNSIMSAFNTTNSGIERGFSAIGYQMATDKCDIIRAGQDNTQRIIDTLNSHWTADLQQRYNDARLELSQQKQNAVLIEALKPTTAAAA